MPTQHLDAHETLAWRWTFRALLVITFGAVLTNRFFYADGCHYFFDILRKEGFDAFASSRLYAQYATQLPVVLAIKLGLSDRLLLAWIFGATLYGLPLLSLWACYRLAEPRRLVIYPMLAFLTGYLSEFSPIVNEIHMMFCVFWVLLFLLMREKIGLAGKAAILVLAFSFLRLYEASLFLAPLLLVPVFWKLRRAASLRRRAFWIAVGALLLYGMGTAGHQILFPRDATNKGNFVAAAGLLWIRNPHIYVYALLAIATVVACRTWKDIRVRTVGRLGVAIIAASLVLFYAHPEFLCVGSSITSRPLLLMVPFGLALPVLYLHRTGCARPVAPRWTWLAAVLIAAYQVGVHTSITIQWHGYQQVVRTVLAEESGPRVVELQDTVLARPKIGNQLVGLLNWEWTLPTLSVVLAPGGRVSRVVYNEAAEYKPLDPHNLPILKDRFGIEYTYLAGTAVAPPEPPVHGVSPHGAP